MVRSYHRGPGTMAHPQRHANAAQVPSSHVPTPHIYSSGAYRVHLRLADPLPPLLPRPVPAPPVPTATPAARSPEEDGARMIMPIQYPMSSTPHEDVRDNPAPFPP